MKITDFENKTFARGLRGYDVQEVDNFINELLEFCYSLENQNKTLQGKVEAYNQQEEFVKEALIAAQQTAAYIKSTAENIAKDIQSNAEKDALELFKNTEKETQIYRDSVYKCFYSYERELRLVIDHFYSLARNHMHQLEKSLSQEIQTVVSRFDNDYNNLPKFSISIKSNKDSNVKANLISDKFKEKEYSILLGRLINRDILNPEGYIVVKKDTVITPEVITTLIRKGLYGELIEAVENKEE